MERPDGEAAPAASAPREAAPPAGAPARPAEAPAGSSGWAIPFPLALAALCGGLVLSIWGAVRTGTPDLALVGAAVVAALAGLYLLSYSRRPMRAIPLPPMPEEEFDDPVEEADRLASTPSPEVEGASPEPATSPPRPDPVAAIPPEAGPLPEGAVPSDR